ncbi:MAG: hypothetical protein MZV63_23965 [Marinilabiliales bacterium]|nr:hypothetical protein [Marinilabiliales bacterium]
MLRGEPAAEQCVVLNNVGFLNNADVDGTARAAGGRAERHDGGRRRAAAEAVRGGPHRRLAVPRGLGRTRRRRAVTGPAQIAVAPYRYLCDGQLTHCVPQPGTDRAPRRAGRQDHVAAGVPPDRRAASRSSPSTR